MILSVKDLIKTLRRFPRSARVMIKTNKAIKLSGSCDEQGQWIVYLEPSDDSSIRQENNKLERK